MTVTELDDRMSSHEFSRWLRRDLDRLAAQEAAQLEADSKARLAQLRAEARTARGR